MDKVLDLWSRIRDYVTIGLVAVSVACATGWYITDLKLDAEKAGRIADRSEYHRAQAEYTAKAIQEKIEIERKNNERAAKADAAYDDLLSKYRSSVMRYQAAQRAYSGDNLSRPSTSTESSDGPSPSSIVPIDTGMILIPLNDADICAVNTARLQVIHEWATDRQ